MSHRAVFDCMLFIQAFLRPGPSKAAFDAVKSGLITLFVSDAVLAEVREVAMRPIVRKRSIRLTVEKAEIFLAEITALAHRIENVPDVYALTRDPKDSIYINLALAA